MKVGDLIWLDYVTSKYIIKISKIGKRNDYHKFSINGIVMWSSNGASLSAKHNNDSGSGFFQFKSYGVYDGDTPIEEILMIEEL